MNARTSWWLSLERRTWWGTLRFVYGSNCTKGLQKISWSSLFWVVFLKVSSPSYVAKFIQLDIYDRKKCLMFASVFSQHHSDTQSVKEILASQGSRGVMPWEFSFSVSKNTRREFKSQNVHISKIFSCQEGKKIARKYWQILVLTKPADGYIIPITFFCRTFRVQIIAGSLHDCVSVN